MLLQHFHLVTLFDLTLAFTFTQYNAHSYMLTFFIPLGWKPFGKAWVHSCYCSAVTAVHSCYPVSPADKAKSDDFDLRPNLDLIVTYKRFFFNSHNEYLLRSFDGRLPHLATATGSRVSHGGGGFTLPSAARSAGDPSAARGKI